MHLQKLFRNLTSTSVGGGGFAGGPEDPNRPARTYIPNTHKNSRAYELEDTNEQCNEYSTTSSPQRITLGYTYTPPPTDIEIFI